MLNVVTYRCESYSMKQHCPQDGIRSLALLSKLERHLASVKSLRDGRQTDGGGAFFARFEQHPVVIVGDLFHCDPAEFDAFSLGGQTIQNVVHVLDEHRVEFPRNLDTFFNQQAIVFTC